MCLCSPSSIIWYQPKSGDAHGWEDRCKSGVALAMRHRLNGHGKGDEHPAYTLEGHGMLYLYLCFRQILVPKTFTLILTLT